MEPKNSSFSYGNLPNPTFLVSILAFGRAWVSLKIGIPQIPGFIIMCPITMAISCVFPQVHAHPLRPGVGPVHLILLELLLPFAGHLTLQLKAVLKVPAGSHQLARGHGVV